MPHLRIEYSSGLADRVDADGLCRTAYDAMQQTGIFPQAGIRVRAFCADHYIVADNHPNNDFAAVYMIVGAGRATDMLQRAGRHIFAALQAYLAEPLASPHFALSLDIRVSDPDLSWKDTPIHDRLTSKD